MPQSLSLLLVHIVFSTKDRRPWLNDTVRPGLHAYLATVARDHQCDCFRVGGVADHVHLAVRLHSTITLAELIEALKTSSSKWLKAQGIDAFAWQRGYGAFSVGPADADALIAYIDQQGIHHRKTDFKTEMRAFLQKYQVPYDERYVWD